MQRLCDCSKGYVPGIFFQFFVEAMVTSNKCSSVNHSHFNHFYNIIAIIGDNYNH